MLGLTARTVNDCFIAEPGVDTDEIRSHAVDADVFDDNHTRRLGFAGAVVLGNLVFGLLGSSTDDGGVTGAEDRDGVFTDIAGPNVG